MKQQFTCAFLSLVLLSGCQTKANENNTEEGEICVQQISAGYISSAGTGKIKADTKYYFNTPFNTEITGNIYYKENQYTDSDISDISESFKYHLQYYHALVDRHYDYKLYSSENDKTGTKINNVKTINESYGTEKPVIVDEFLYDVLKASYEFTLNSDGKFNMFLGAINDIYESKLNSNNSSFTALDYSLTLANDFTFASDFDEKEISQAVSFLPITKEELNGLLSFNDNDHSVTFHKLSKVTNDVYAPQISLGGNGKGYAIQRLSTDLSLEFPGISMLINAGHSSIKTVGTKPSSSPWKIKYTNPVYRERTGISSSSKLISEEVGIAVDGQFNLSTSAYYEQYFYVYQKDEDIYLRRSHIINPTTGYSESFFDQVSVLNDDAGLADMYTTALMNTTSVKEAYELFGKLNRIYQQDDSALILCYKSKKDDFDTLYQYKNSELSNLSSYQYPTLKRKSDGTIYSGDYTDLTSKDIYNDYQINSLPNREFSETYYMTKNVYDKRIIIEEGGLAVMKEINI